MDYLRIYSESDGCSHFETVSIEFSSQNYAPPAPPLNLSSTEPATASVFLELPVGWYGDWHPTPVRQWLVLMSGSCEFEVQDGSMTTRKAGDLVMLDDRVGKGHRTRVLGAEPVRIAAIHI